MLGYSTLPAVNGLSRSHNAPSVLQTDGFQTEGLASSPAKALISGLRRLVPSDEERFQSSGFDLNLSYITARCLVPEATA